MESLKKAIALGTLGVPVLVATADVDGLPHIGVAGAISMESGDRVALSGWFCPGTVANLNVNVRMAIVVWDPEKDTGFQLFGVSEDVVDLAIMDGYSPETESESFPQTEEKVVVRVDKIVKFTRAPHTDVEA